MGDIKREITYFEFCGEVNTEKVLEFSKKRCEETGIKKVIIASETGRSALKALKIFKGSDIKLIVVTHYPANTWGPKGDIPIGLMRSEYSNARETLLRHSVEIVQGTRPFAPVSRSLGWDNPTPETLIDKTLELFGAGTKIAVEATIMATDSGVVREGEEVVTCGGTYKGLDTALIVRTAYSMNFFKNFEVVEIIAKPACRVKNLPEYTCKNWKGNLEQYYKKK